MLYSDTRPHWCSASAGSSLSPPARGWAALRTLVYGHTGSTAEGRSEGKPGSLHHYKSQVCAPLSHPPIPISHGWGVRTQNTFLPGVGGTEHSGNTALRSRTSLVQAVEQTSPELVSSLQGQVTLSQIFFSTNVGGWNKSIPVQCSTALWRWLIWSKGPAKPV